MDLREVGWGGKDWIDLAQDRDRWWAYEHSNEPSCPVKCRAFLEYLRTC
jgi:hypothetical protein